MRGLGLRGASRAKKHFTTRSDPAAVRAPDLVKRNFTAARPDALWVADFTYCSTWSGIVYVAFIIDVFSRRLIACRVPVVPSRWGCETLPSFNRDRPLLVLFRA
jgi:putative transposase